MLYREGTAATALLVVTTAVAAAVVVKFVPPKRWWLVTVVRNRFPRGVQPATLWPSLYTVQQTGNNNLQVCEATDSSRCAKFPLSTASMPFHRAPVGRC
jgi:hypothetical protein